MNEFDAPYDRIAREAANKTFQLTQESIAVALEHIKEKRGIYDYEVCCDNTNTQELECFIKPIEMPDLRVIDPFIKQW